jgi:hypothetical protein
MMGSLDFGSEPGQEFFSQRVMLNFGHPLPSASKSYGDHQPSVLQPVDELGIETGPGKLYLFGSLDHPHPSVQEILEAIACQNFLVGQFHCAVINADHGLSSGFCR